MFINRTCKTWSVDLVKSVEMATMHMLFSSLAYVFQGCDDYVNEYLRVRYDKGKEDQFQDEHVKAMFYMNPVLDYYR